MTSIRPLQLTLLVGIMLLAAALRFTHLESNPGWYTDEGTHLEIAKHLLDGEIRYLAINQSHLIFSRLPLFGRLLATAAAFQGISMLTLRGLTASLGVLSVWLTYFASQALVRDRWVALAAAFSLAIFPEAVLYSRFGFSYALLSPLLLIAIWGAGKCRNGSEAISGVGLWIAAGAIGLGLISDLAVISLMPWLIWVTLTERGRKWIGPLLLAGIPLGLFVLIQLITNAEAFWFDQSFVRGRLGGQSFLDQLGLIAQNVTLLLTQSSWFALGFVGLWLIPASRSRNILLLALASPLVILGRTAPLTELSYYYIAWVLPILAIGFGALLRFGAERMMISQENRRVGVGIAIFVLALPLITATFFTWQRVQGDFGTTIDRFLLDAEDAMAATDFVNAQLEADDVVIASPGLAWRIEGQVADFQMALAAEGIAPPHLPADLPAERFEFDPRFETATYVVEDNLWRNWAYFHIPELEEKRDTFTQWPIVFQSGEITVYQAPSGSIRR